MGIKLVEEVMDYAPDTLTTGEWKGLIVLARDANDRTRRTFTAVTDPVILRRVRLSPAAWANVRSALIRKGVLEVVTAGVKGRAATYRIPRLAPQGIPHPTDEESGDLHPTDEASAEIPHPVGEASSTMPHPTGDANPEYLTQQMTPTPPYSSTTSSSRRPPAQRVEPPAPPAAPEEEDKNNNPNTNRARLLLSRLPAPWALGPLDAQRIAPQLADTAARLGWELDDRLVAAICTNPGGMNDPADVIAKRRIPNLLPYAQVHGPRNNLPPACQPCLDDSPPAARNPRFRTRNGRPCPTCHPDQLRRAA